MSNKPRYGVFYVSNGKWTGPYKDIRFTKYTWNRDPVKSYLKYLKNRLLKSNVKLCRVKS